MTVSPIWTVWCDGEQLHASEPLTAGGSLTDILNHRCHHWCEATGDSQAQASALARDMGWRRIRTPTPTGYKPPRPLPTLPRPPPSPADGNTGNRPNVIRPVRALVSAMPEWTAGRTVRGMRKHLRYGALVLSAAMLGAMATLGLTARATTPNDQIHACVYNGFLLGLGTGAVRVIPAGATCNAGETSLNWTQTGVSFGPSGARKVDGATVNLIPTADYQPVTVSCAANETPFNGSWHIDATGYAQNWKVGGGPSSYTYPPDPSPTYTVGMFDQLAPNLGPYLVPVHATVYCLTTS